MKILSIRCDVCKLELENESGVFHKNIRINSFTVGGNTHFRGEDKHYCSIECAFESIKGEIVSVPLPIDRLKALAEELEYEIKKKILDEKSSKTIISKKPSILEKEEIHA